MPIAATVLHELGICCNGAKALLEEAQRRIGDNPLRNALAAFYLQQGSKEGAVEYVHKSFGEFLCAQRLKGSLEEWTKPGKKGRGFNVSDEVLHWEIYDLLGYGGLTPEIVEYLMGLLTISPSPLIKGGSFVQWSCLSVWKIFIYAGAMGNLLMHRRRLYLRKRRDNYKSKEFS